MCRFTRRPRVFVRGAGAGSAVQWQGTGQSLPHFRREFNSTGPEVPVGVLYRIEPGWHIYWKYSGDSGIPTKIEWQLPQGFRVRRFAVAVATCGKKSRAIWRYLITPRRFCCSPTFKLRRLCRRTDYDSGKNGLAGLSESVCSGASAAFSYFEHGCRTPRPTRLRSFRNMPPWFPRDLNQIRSGSAEWVKA